MDLDVAFVSDLQLESHPSAATREHAYIWDSGAALLPPLLETRATAQSSLAGRCISKYSTIYKPQTHLQQASMCSGDALYLYRLGQTSTCQLRYQILEMKKPGYVVPSRCLFTEPGCRAVCQLYQSPLYLPNRTSCSVSATSVESTVGRLDLWVVL